MMDVIRIELLPARGAKTPVRLNGVEIGCWRDPETEAARWLLRNGRTKAGDRMVMVRGGVRALTDPIGWMVAQRPGPETLDKAA
jgi:hypothetical protein